MPPIFELDLVGPLDVFAHPAAKTTAEAQDGGQTYEVIVAGAGEGRTVTGMRGLTLTVGVHYSQISGPIDTLFVISGAAPADISQDTQLCAWLKTISKDARRICSICTGAFVLASAGVLDGRRVATHWAYAKELEANYPSIQVDPDPIWLKDGPIYSSAGATASIDLALSLVEDDIGAKAALDIARMLVVFLKRAGSQNQLSRPLSAQQATTRTPFTDLAAWISENLDKPLNVETLAEQVAMSPRNFARVFHAEIGTTPASFVRRMRIEAARTLLEQTQRGLDDIASRCGFGNDEAMRRAFVEDVGLTPGQYRSSFGGGRLIRR
ncbi:transcriptional regulator GlxA family with amidase domain [Lysobacter niabensis]|uniref:Transcriptional regulator GlxA family with amidase domain n=1 Tax=Agrilutibacter niabensis TaxID=380628 RepID=A0ABU1VQM8_9GAMM|nr:transcriptional regulator GlxA family with amidase domain [Lysobacter niabensis]